MRLSRKARYTGITAKKGRIEEIHTLLNDAKDLFVDVIEEM